MYRVSALCIIFVLLLMLFLLIFFASCLRMPLLYYQSGRQFRDSAPRAENGADCAQGAAKGQQRSSSTDCSWPERSHGECKDFLWASILLALSFGAGALHLTSLPFSH